MKPISVRRSIIPITSGAITGWVLACRPCDERWDYRSWRFAVRTAHQHATWHTHVDRHKR